MVTTYRSWRDDRTVRLGAGLAYYGVFAVVPILTVAVAVAQVLFRRADTKAFIDERIETLLGTEGDQLAALIDEQLAKAATQTGLGLLGGVSLLFAASLVVLALQDAFNTIWKVPVTPGLRFSLRRRLRALVVVLSTGALLSAALVVQTATSVMRLLLPGWLERASLLVGALGVVASWMVVVVGFVLLFRFMIPVDVGWRVVAFVGALTAAAATVGTWVLAIYLRRVGGGSLTGVAGSLLLGLVWIFYEAQILLAGGQLAKVLQGEQVPALARRGHD